MIDQWIYASCLAGRSGYSGAQTYASSGGVSVEEETELIRLTVFPPPVSDRNLLRAHGFKRLETPPFRWCVYKCTHGSRKHPVHDAAGHPASLIHAFLVPDKDGQPDLPLPPWCYLDTPDFHEPLTEAEIKSRQAPPPLPALAKLRPGEIARKNGTLRAELAKLQAQTGDLLACAMDGGMHTFNRVLIIAPSATQLLSEVARAMAVLWELTPPELRSALSVSTCLHPVNLSAFTLVGWNREQGRPPPGYNNRFGSTFSWSIPPETARKASAPVTARLTAFLAGEDLSEVPFAFTPSLSQVPHPEETADAPEGGLSASREPAPEEAPGLGNILLGASEPADLEPGLFQLESQPPARIHQPNQPGKSVPIAKESFRPRIRTVPSSDPENPLHATPPPRRLRPAPTKIRFRPDPWWQRVELIPVAIALVILVLACWGVWSAGTWGAEKLGWYPRQSGSSNGPAGGSPPNTAPVSRPSIPKVSSTLPAVQKAPVDAAGQPAPRSGVAIKPEEGVQTSLPGIQENAELPVTMPPTEPSAKDMKNDIAELDKAAKGLSAMAPLLGTLKPLISGETLPARLDKMIENLESTDPAKHVAAADMLLAEAQKELPAGDAKLANLREALSTAKEAIELVAKLKRKSSPVSAGYAILNMKAGPLKAQLQTAQTIMRDLKDQHYLDAIAECSKAWSAAVPELLKPIEEEVIAQTGRDLYELKGEPFSNTEVIARDSSVVGISLQVETVERILAKEGFYSGSMDGTMNKALQDAILKAQHQLNITPVDGRVTPELMRKVGSKTEGSGSPGHPLPITPKALLRK